MSRSNDLPPAGQLDPRADTRTARKRAHAADSTAVERDTDTGRHRRPYHGELLAVEVSNRGDADLHGPSRPVDLGYDTRHGARFTAPRGGTLTEALELIVDARVYPAERRQDVVAKPIS
jgi:hypothetical protein